MRLADLKRNKKEVLKHLSVQEDSSVINKTECFIYIPERWAGSLLADIDSSEVSILGMFILVVGNNYTLFNAMAMFSINPTTFRTIDFDGVPCIEFKFNPGATVFTTLHLVKDGNLGREIFEFFINVGGSIPYFTRNDALLLFETLGSFAGLPVPNQSLNSLIIQHVLRSEKDKKVFSRHLPENAPFVNISFRAVRLAAPDTYSKITGGYFEEGINDCLITKTTEPNRAEKPLRI